MKYSASILTNTLFSFAQKPENGGSPAKLKADSKNKALKNGLVLIRPPSLARSLVALLAFTIPLIKNKLVLAKTW